MYNSNMVLSFLYKYIDNRCRIPDDMLDENIRAHYNKPRMLIRKDKELPPHIRGIQRCGDGGVRGNGIILRVPMTYYSVCRHKSKTGKP